ncbi:DUF2950 domain-containing protein [Amaricoccus sp.]|uniref:DUF2950 domain-containing protein n=1 Tax=Amaricoccus sp. TaxID=1872485 RepID=UPI00261C173B|nr:DUF2950 domain-containing protein [Amaricoccus sp.]HRO10759.1 DUF2950 domain-containing protein [Amaricoccus sp.]
MTLDLPNSCRAALAAVLLVSAAPLAAEAEPQSFPTPDAAAEAVIAALRAKDPDALLAVFGPENADVIFSGDDPADREDWRQFLASYEELHRIAVAPGEEGERATLYIGRAQWPFPVEIAEADGAWRFDAAAARDEVLLRRIGQNELDVIDLLHGYVRAQAAYRSADPDGNGLPSFAAAILSTAGTHDGLYWPSEPGQPESPIGDFMARAAADGYSIDGTDVEPEPYLGYYFHILTKQGPHAPGGALDYMVNGQMVAGHALVAFPADYGQTGVMSFMVGEAGIVYEADLGEDTLSVAAAIDSFDPGDGWSPVEE